MFPTSIPVAGQSLQTPDNRFLPLSGYLLLFLVFALSLFGLVALSSAGWSVSHIDPLMMMKRQILWMIIALTAGFAAFSVDIQVLRRFGFLVAIPAFVLLVLVLIPGIGHKVNGASRWLDLGPMRFQPSDLGKLALVLLLSSYLSVNQRRIHHFLWGFGIPMVIIGVFCLLILMEPDYGTCILCGSVSLCLLFIAGVRLRYLIPSCLVAIAGLGYLIRHDPVRWKRITSFLAPYENRVGDAYQLWEALVSFGLGEVFGVGLGNGKQQLRYLPEAHTDFIFPVIAEEFGLIGTVLIATLFLCVFTLLIISLRKAPDLYQFMLVLGCGFFICFQAMINMGVVTALLPTKGMSLPFISYGGSNLAVMYVFVGIILKCLHNWQKPLVITPSEL